MNGTPARALALAAFATESGGDASVTAATLDYPQTPDTPASTIRELPNTARCAAIGLAIGVALLIATVLLSLLYVSIVVDPSGGVL